MLQQNLSASYGPWNALADILGAYIQKRSIDGAMKYADEANQRMAELQQPRWKQNPVAARQGEAVMQDAVSQMQGAGQMPNIDFLGRGQAQKAPSLLDAANQYGQQPQPQQFQRPMAEYGFTGERVQQQPLSFDDYNAKLQDMRREAMRTMVRKYGTDAAEKALGMIDDNIKARSSAYGDKLLAGQMQGIQSSLIGRDAKGNLARADMSLPQNRLRFLMQVQNYNIAAQRMGKPLYDMNVAKELLSSDNIKQISIDAGGNIQLYGTKANGSSFDDGSRIQPIATIGKTLTPGQIQQSQEKAKDRAFQLAKQKDQQAFTAGQNALKLQSQREIAAMRGARSGSSGGGSNTKLRNAWNKASSALDLAYQSIGTPQNPGTSFTDEEDHNVEEARQALFAAREACEDDEDRQAIDDELAKLENAYKEVYQAYAD